MRDYRGWISSEAYEDARRAFATVPGARIEEADERWAGRDRMLVLCASIDVAPGTLTVVGTELLALGATHEATVVFHPPSKYRAAWTVTLSVTRAFDAEDARAELERIAAGSAP